MNNGLNNSFNTTNKQFLTMSVGLLFEETLSSRICPFIALFHLVLFVKQFKQRFVRSPYLSFSSSEIDNPYSFRVTFENTSFIRMIPMVEPSLCRYRIWTPTITHKLVICYFKAMVKLCYCYGKAVILSLGIRIADSF